MTNVLISAAGLCGATIIGAILGFFVKELPHKWNDAVLGYCAGLMLAASTLGLIVPAFEQTSLWWLGWCRPPVSCTSFPWGCACTRWALPQSLAYGGSPLRVYYSLPAVWSAWLSCPSPHPEAGRRPAGGR